MSAVAVNDANALRVSEKPRVLFVEDDKEILGLVKLMAKLETRFQLEMASDGEGAKAMYEAAKAEGRPYRLMVMDMALGPGLTGMEVIQAVRESGDEQTLLVIFSAYIDEAMAFLAGVHHVLEKWDKPMGATDLMEDIKRVLELPDDVAHDGGERRKGMVEVQRRQRRTERLLGVLITLVLFALVLFLFLFWRQNGILVRMDGLLNR